MVISAREMFSLPPHSPIFVRSKMHASALFQSPQIEFAVPNRLKMRKTTTDYMTPHRTFSARAPSWDFPAKSPLYDTMRGVVDKPQGLSLALFTYYQ